MLKIGRLVDGELVVFVLSGRVADEDLPQLESLVQVEPQNIVLDLKEVSLVGREIVKFLARCEDSGATLRNCPEYVREWVDKERGKK